MNLPSRTLHFFFTFLLIATVALCSSATEQKPASQTTVDATASQTTVDPTNTPYRIEKGDELEIKSLHNPEINSTVVVRPDGKISMPLAHEIEAAGKTPEGLAKELASKYASEFREPEVAVIVRTFNGHRVFVGGEVRKPGTVSLAGPLTVLQAISQSEGFNGSARISEVILIRRGANSEPTSRVIDLKKAMNGKDPKQDMLLMPYDIIYVPRSRIANVNNFFQNVIRSAIPLPFSMSYRVDNN